MTDNEIKKVSIEEFSRLQDYMLLADKDSQVYQAMKKLPEWMVEVSEHFDAAVNNQIIEGIACR